MIPYLHNEKIGEQGFVPFDPAANGGTNITGDPKATIKIDLQQDKITAGLYIQEPSGIDIVWPFTEHAFVVDGSVTVTDLDSGKKTIYGPGDGWVIKQGSRTRWEVTSRLTKSFLSVSE